MSQTKKPSKRCPECGFKIRGKNHENGSHHNAKKTKK